MASGRRGVQQTRPQAYPRVGGFDLIVVGTSLGGFQALKELLGSLPVDLGVPVAIVQHVSENGAGELPSLLARHSALPVLEPEDGESFAPGAVYIAPAGYHLLIEERGQFALSTEAPVLYARPSIDVLFESAAEVYGPRLIGVALTSSSTDGAAGLARIKGGGGYVIVQDPGSAESSVLPRAALAATPVDRVLHLPEMGPFLATLCRGTGRSPAADGPA